MILDIFSELQRPGPFAPDHEARLFADAVEQAVLADRLGFGCWWTVEHHGAVEFSYSSAPEIVVAALAQRTERLRFGHSGVLAPFRINHPLRVAERAAWIDLVSNGRLEMGLARSGGTEWEAFGVDAETSRDQLREALLMLPRMWTQEQLLVGERARRDPRAQRGAQAAPEAAPAALADRHQPGILRDGGRARRGGARDHAALAARLALGALRPLPEGPRALPSGGPLREREPRRLHLPALRGVAEGGDREPRGRGRALVRERRAARLQRAAQAMDRRDPRLARGERPGRDARRPREPDRDGSRPRTIRSRWCGC